MTHNPTQTGSETPIRRFKEIDGVINVDESGRILLISAEAQRLLGSGSDALVGQSVALLIPERERLERLDAFQKAWKVQGCLPSGLIELTVVDAKGREFEARISLFTMLSQGNRIFTAVIREAETPVEATRASEDPNLHPLHITTRLFEHAIEGMVVMDPQWRVLVANHAFAAICGYENEDLTGQSAPLFQDAEIVDGSREEAMAELARKGEWRGEISNRRPNGELYQESLILTAIQNQDGEISHYVAVCRDLSSAIRTEEEFRFHTSHDALTGLPNRFLFTDRLDQILTHAKRTGEKVTLVIFGLDAFKNINDSLGHSIGDEILRRVSQRVRVLIRGEDTLGRLSGDEFAIIFRNANQDQSTLKVIQKLMGELSRPFRIEDQELALTASLGLTLFPMDGGDAATLIRNTSLALDRAKKEGKNTFKYYTSSMGNQATKRLILENSLRKALEQEEFVVHYQPKVDVATGEIMGMESLIRWNQPGMGMVPPGDFISIAEETGLIVPMGRWVLEKSCRQTQRWLDAGLGPLRVAINLSARQFQEGGLNQTILDVLKESGLPPENLELEITESLMMFDVQQSIATLQELSGIGLRVSVDDFGTGYSSLSYLKQFPINTLKIDRSFVNNLANGSEDAAIVRAILSLAHSLNLEVVAEGVETQDQLDLLREWGCEEFQGFFFSRPLDAQPFEELLIREREAAKKIP